MQQSVLLGKHTHETAAGVRVHVWRRGDGTYLARGRFQGLTFGKTLDKDERQAEQALYRVLVEISDGTFQRPSEARKNRVRRGPVPRFTLRQLAEAKACEARGERGKDTADAYWTRLFPLVEYSELKQVRARFPIAESCEREFAGDYKAHLYTLKVTRNGHPCAQPTSMSPRQIYNCLASGAMLFRWGKDRNYLPAGFVNPFTKDLVGERPMRDPMQAPPFPLALRIELVNSMDPWELCTLCWQMTLPQRPEDFTGLLISDVHVETRELLFQGHLGGNDFGKAKAPFRCVYPEQFDPIVRRCIGGRTEGPLLLKRREFEGRRRPRLRVSDGQRLAKRYEASLDKARREVKAPGDRKRLFRRLLLPMGGVRTDTLAKPFKALLRDHRPALKGTFYDLRDCTASDMQDACVDLLVRKYVMGRSLRREIQANYEFQNVALQMGRYFRHISPLLDAIARRATELGMN